MSALNGPESAERRSGDGSGGSASGLAGQLHRTRGAVWNVHATERVVTGRTQARYVWDVRCPSCGALHQHLSREPVATAVRTSPCGTTYLLHVVVDGAA